MAVDPSEMPLRCLIADDNVPFLDAPLTCSDVEGWTSLGLPPTVPRLRAYQSCGLLSDEADDG